MSEQTKPAAPSARWPLTVFLLTCAVIAVTCTLLVYMEVRGREEKQAAPEATAKFPEWKLRVTVKDMQPGDTCWVYLNRILIDQDRRVYLSPHAGVNDAKVCVEAAKSGAKVSPGLARVIRNARGWEVWVFAQPNVEWRREEVFSWQKEIPVTSIRFLPANQLQMYVEP